MEMIRWFQELGRDALAEAGGKGANLGEMARAGLPVPPGFVLTTAAYREFVARNAAQPAIERLAGAGRADDSASLESAARAIAELFTAGRMPEEIAREVRDAYARLGAGPVAVRSSATAEDLPGASFAGQQETYLNVRGEQALLAAVRRCWASLWTPRAIAYRLRQGIPPSAVSLAVVVQQMIPAEVAGILFTANPVNGRRDQMVIDAAWGLGEAVVGGRVTPDHWLADARTGAVLQARVAHKEVMTARAESGVVTLPVPPDRQDRPALDAPQVSALVELGRRVAAHYGEPQDIEWALAQGRLYLLQARPITSLFPLPQPEPPPGAGLRVYVSINVVQGFVEPFTPTGLAIGRTVARAIASVLGSPPGAVETPFKTAACRAFLDVTAVLEHPVLRRGLLRAATQVDHHIAAILAELVARGELPEGHRGLPIRPPAPLLLRVAGRLARSILFPDAGRRRLLAAAEAQARALERSAEGLHGLPARLHWLHRRLPACWAQLPGLVFPLVLPGLGARFLAEALLEKWFGDARALEPVLRSLPHNPTTEMGLALWRLSRKLKAEGVEPAADHPAVRAFLARYGHRGVREIDVGLPRWREDPTQVLAVLRTYINQGEEADAERQFRAGERAAEEALSELVARVRREKGRLRALLLKFLLRRVRALAGTREDPKFYAVRTFAVVRQVLAGAGAELAAAGKLERADDGFFLDLDDLSSPADLRARVAANRAEYQRELSRRVIPRVITSTGETFYTAPAAADGALRGAAASPGVHEGRVRVILDPKDARIEPGEVLVAPGTDPAWTPLFLSAGALVTEVGGMITHGSIVAREYGIPAVVGVPDATRRLRTGQRVRVDGERGLVVPLEP
jgi:pyruvate,water dikinase